MKFRRQIFLNQSSLGFVEFFIKRQQVVGQLSLIIFKRVITNIVESLLLLWLKILSISIQLTNQSICYYKSKSQQKTQQSRPFHHTATPPLLHCPKTPSNKVVKSGKSRRKVVEAAGVTVAKLVRLGQNEIQFRKGRESKRREKDLGKGGSGRKQRKYVSVVQKWGRWWESEEGDECKLILVLYKCSNKNQGLNNNYNISMSVSEQASEPPLSQQNNQPHIANENTNNLYRPELTIQQAAFLTKLLPPGFSFQLDPKTLKRSTSSVKNFKQEPRLPQEIKKKSTKDEPKPLTSKTSSRAPKASNNKFTEENQNAVYQKYNAQKDFRRNTFENVSEALRPCVRILTQLKNSRTSWPFREPVDPIALGIPHYTEVVKEPMDLSTIQNNLRTNQYITPTQFHADVAKIITNSYTFNSSNIEFTRITAEFEAYYRKITAESTSDLPRSYSHTELPLESHPSKSIALEAKKSKKEVRDVDASAPIITMAQKKELGLNIKKLPKEFMKGILDIVNEGKGKIIGEFDLKQLDPYIIRKLQVYVKEKLSSDSKPKAGFANDKNNHRQHEEESSFEVGEEDES